MEIDAIEEYQYVACYNGVGHEGKQHVARMLAKTLERQWAKT